MALSVRYERDGLVLPRAIGGDSALDLVNTFAGWSQQSAGSTREYLRSYDHLVLWSASLGTVAEGEVGPLRRAGRRDPAAADEVLERAKQLRAAVHDLLLNREETTATEAALRTVHDLAGAALATAGLRWGPPAALEFGGVRSPLDALAWHCLLFLGTPAATQVRACPGRDCGWLFVDRTGRRRWCRMEWCGNRAKVRAHARRLREPD